MSRNLFILFAVTFAIFAISVPAIHGKHGLQDKITQELIDFLLRTGGELIRETEKFLHEIRWTIGESAELHHLEHLILNFEITLIELRNQSLSDLSESDRLHEVHRIEERLVKQEGEITEEMARIEKLIANIITTTSRPSSEDPDIKLAIELLERAQSLSSTYHGDQLAKLQYETAQLQIALSEAQKSLNQNKTSAILTLAIHNSRMIYLLQQLEN